MTLLARLGGTSVQLDDVMPLLTPEELQRTTVYGQTPLHVALERCGESVVIAIFKAWPGAAQVREHRYGDYPLHKACYFCRFHRDATIVQMLLDEWPEAARMVDREGKVPLSRAVSGRSRQTMTRANIPPPPSVLLAVLAAHPGAAAHVPWDTWTCPIVECWHDGRDGYPDGCDADVDMKRLSSFGGVQRESEDRLRGKRLNRMTLINQVMKICRSEEFLPRPLWQGTRLAESVHPLLRLHHAQMVWALSRRYLLLMVSRGLQGVAKTIFEFLEGALPLGYAACPCPTCAASVLLRRLAGSARDAHNDTCDEEVTGMDVVVGGGSTMDAAVAYYKRSADPWGC